MMFLSRFFFYVIVSQHQFNMFQPTFNEFVKLAHDGYKNKSMDYILDVEFVNGRDRFPLNPEEILHDMAYHGHHGSECPCANWVKVYSIGNIDRLFLKLSEHMINSNVVHT